MNCQTLIAKMGFQCRDIDQDTLRVWTPFTYGSDGQIVALYVERTNSGYRITDNCEALMHASSMGINFTQSKISAISRAVGYRVSISSGGEISALVSADDVGDGVAMVVNAAMAVSHFESTWMPRNRAESFVKSVTSVLESELGERVLKNVSVVGSSGHQLELPLAVKSGNASIYIQPIASSDDDGIEWKDVYAGYGRMLDIKSAEIPDTSRMFVLEDAANDDEMNKATMLLATSASVVRYSKLRDWAKRKAA